MHAWVVVASLIGVWFVVTWILVIYGTLARNKWGVNLRPVSCPRCGERVPVIREPRSVQQFRWGNWTCPSCGIEVDKWGKEIAPVGPGPIDSMAVCKIRIQAMNRVMLQVAPVIFCLALLGNLLLLRREPFPLTWSLASTLVIPAILEVAIIGAIIYFAFRLAIVAHYSQKAKEQESARTKN